jgi:hypothetical protein
MQMKLLEIIGVCLNVIIHLPTGFLRSKEWVCSRSLAVIVGPNPADVCLLCALCVVG